VHIAPEGFRAKASAHAFRHRRARRAAIMAQHLGRRVWPRVQLAERASLEIDQGIAATASTPGADLCYSYCFGRLAGPALSPS